MVTIERPSAGEARGASRRRNMFAVLVVVVLAAVGAAVWTLTNGESEKTPIEEVQELAAAMRDNDIDKVNELLVPDASYGDFIVWSTALNAEPMLTDCTSTGHGRAFGEPVPSSIRGSGRPGSSSTISCGPTIPVN